MNRFSVYYLLPGLLLLLSVLIPSKAAAQTCVCEGRYTKIIFQYSHVGVAGVTLSIYEDRDANSQIFSFANVQSGDFITVRSSDIGLARFGPKIYLSIDNGVNLTEVHTSCSVNIIGETYVDFTAVYYIDYHGDECFHPDISLPVEWAGLDVTHEGTFAQLEWETLSELNNDRFEIERSIDLQVFEVIGTVNGAGTSQERQSYHFADYSLPKGSGNRIYYRIKQVDFNGSYDYSSLLELHIPFSSKVEFQVYPNPVSDVLHIKTNATNGQLRFIDTRGKVLMHQTLDQHEALQQISFDLTSLQSGIYFIQLFTKEGIHAHRILHR